MYDIGDLVVYGAEGVFRVVDIGCPDIVPTRDREYYTLAPLYSSGKTYAPVDSEIRMRPVISAEEAHSLIKSMPQTPAEPYKENNVHKLTDYYKSIIRTYDCKKLIQLIRSIYLKRQKLAGHGKKLGQLDERYLKRAEGMLHEELSAALSIPISDVKEYIMDSIGELEATAVGQ